MTETYRDRVTIDLHQLNDLYDLNPELIDGYTIVITPHGTIDLDWLHQVLETAFHEDHSPTGLQTQPYQIEQRRKDRHVGAAGASAQFIVDTATSLGADATDTIIGYILGLVTTKAAERGYTIVHGKLETLDPTQVNEKGLAAIANSYGIDVDDLTLTSQGSNDEHEYTVTAAATDGSRYTVSFIVRRGQTEIRQSRMDTP